MYYACIKLHDSFCMFVCMSGVYYMCMCWSHRRGSPSALLAGSMCQWLIPQSLKGQAPPPPPYPVLLSPPHHHLRRWVLLFPHRILIMAIEGFQRGWFTLCTPAAGLNGVMMQAVAEGGKREDTTSKQTMANANKDFLLGCLSASFWIHEVLLCWKPPKHGRTLWEKASGKFWTRV